MANWDYIPPSHLDVCDEHLVGTLVQETLLQPEPISKLTRI